MKTAKTITKTITSKQQFLNPDDFAINPKDSNLETLDNTEFELEKIMFEEFAKGLPSDIPMADF